ncbi:MAG: hypothetical protein KBH94_06375 [Caldisericia bacterium]|nr:hypothetical protein [Caldisericia bacterium]
MDNWRKFFTIMIVVDLIVIGVWSYLSLRTREYQSADGQPITFPLWEGWIVEIRIDQDEIVYFEAASSEYFYLQKLGSKDPQDVIAGKPSERPVNYQDDSYFLVMEKVKSSDWIVKEASSAEGVLGRYGTEIHVRTYPQGYVVAQTIIATSFVVLAFSLLIALFVWGTNN